MVKQKEEELEQKEKELEQERQRAEQKEKELEQERQRAEQERQRLVNIIKSMHESGLSVEQIARITKIEVELIMKVLENK
ncbi:MAG: hypothetical protein N3A01_03670 [Bacteroidales bacterium]|nr:hypothetical protein [Bacteroidales bacterium]